MRWGSPTLKTSTFPGTSDTSQPRLSTLKRLSNSTKIRLKPKRRDGIYWISNACKGAQKATKDNQSTDVSFGGHLRGDVCSARLHSFRERDPNPPCDAFSCARLPRSSRARVGGEDLGWI